MAPRSPKNSSSTSTRTLAGDPATAQATVGALAQAFLSIADTDHDGQVSPAEFFAFQRGHFPNLTETDANDAFSHLDADGNGLLSVEEFTQAIIEFWSSTDPNAPGNWWMGRPHLLAVIPELTLSRKDRPAEAAGTGDGNAGLYSLRARELVFAAGAIPVAPDDQGG